MEDLSALLASVLEDPAAMEKLRNVAGGLVGEKKTEGEPKKETEPFSIGGDLMGMISKFAPILSAVNKEDDTTRLLHALRPFLEEERRNKIDEAAKIMQILKVLPILKENKIL